MRRDPNKSSSRSCVCIHSRRLIHSCSLLRKPGRYRTRDCLGSPLCSHAASPWSCLESRSLKPRLLLPWNPVLLRSCCRSCPALKPRSLPMLWRVITRGIVESCEVWPCHRERVWPWPCRRLQEVL